MRARLEADRFQKYGGKGEPIEWIALQTMKTRLGELRTHLEKLLPFNPNDLVVELAGFVELLNDIKAGKLTPNDY